VKPVWLDIDQCVDSDYSNPVGILRHSLGVERQRAGKVIAAVGHMHGHWAAVEATNESRAGGSICRSDAKLHPTDVHRILSMSTCTGDPMAVVRRGEIVLPSMYQSSHVADDVTGIMLMYIHQT
jgi:Stress up-regulated Nod 19